MDNVYIGIGNSDDKLSQARWARFIEETRGCLMDGATVRGEWYSLANQIYQNVTWWIQIEPGEVFEMQKELQVLAVEFGQDSIAWTEAKEAVFIGPGTFLPLD